MKPTESQIGLLYRIMHWSLPNDLAANAVNWLQANATRKEVSAEITRVQKLHDSHKLDKDTCFSSGIWRGYRVEVGDAE